MWPPCWEGCAAEAIEAPAIVANTAARMTVFIGLFLSFWIEILASPLWSCLGVFICVTHTYDNQQTLEHPVTDSYNSVMTNRRTANLLGALALALGDQMRLAAERRLGRGGETPAALATIGHEPGLSVDMLRQILGLTHSGGVRLVDRLTAEGLVERRPGADGRTLALYLTEKGSNLRCALIEDRTKPLEKALLKLPDGDLRLLDRVLDRLLYELCEGEVHAYSICRLCDDSACEDCPIGRACADSSGVIA
jgi:MarR family transcriptional repressor of emrRAB